MPRVNVRNTPRLKQEIQKAGLDVLLVFSMENILYLSGALFALKNNLRGRLASAGFTKDGFDFLVGVTMNLALSGNRPMFMKFVVMSNSRVLFQKLSCKFSLNKAWNTLLLV